MTKPQSKATLRVKEIEYLTHSTQSLTSSGKPRTHVDDLIASTHSLTWSGSQAHLPSAGKHTGVTVVSDQGQEIEVPKVGDAVDVLWYFEVCGLVWLYIKDD